MMSEEDKTVDLNEEREKKPRAVPVACPHCGNLHLIALIAQAYRIHADKKVHPEFRGPQIPVFLCFRCGKFALLQSEEPSRIIVPKTDIKFEKPNGRFRR
jgi:hypothetical protein